MPKTRDKVSEVAENIKPYVERAMHDEELRNDVMHAFSTARDLVNDLLTDRDKPVTLASRVATDDDVRDKLREAIEDLRTANDRLQGKRTRAGKGRGLLVAGVALGILFNPVTGAGTRKFIKDMLAGGGDDTHDHDHDTNGKH